VPLTKGDSRGPVVLLYGALVVMLMVALFSDGTGPIPRSAPKWACCRRGRSSPILVLLALAGLRDKVIFLAARGEVYAASRWRSCSPGSTSSWPRSWSAWRSGWAATSKITRTSRS
jgi:hypothetical protein